MSALETMKDLIRSQRRINTERRRFLPQDAVDKISTESNVCTVLKECQVSLYQVEELARNILQGARRIFMVLVLIDEPKAILRFVKYDQFRQGNDLLDSKLPLTDLELSDVLGETTLVEKFAEAQWELAIPTFTRRSIPRVLHDDTIIPIIDAEFKGRGGFGEVFKIRFHPSHVHIAGIRNETVFYNAMAKRGFVVC